MRNADDLKIGIEAADWLFRLEESPQLEASGEFIAWLKRSPRHMGEFLKATATLKRLHLAKPGELADIVRELENTEGPADNIVPLLEGLPGAPKEPFPAPNPIRKRMGIRWASLAAGVIALGVLTGWLLFSSEIGRGIYATRFGEQRSFKLEDGSVLYLNTDSRAQVRYTPTGRDVQLKIGEALFVVAQDKSRPFRVHAGESLVQAVGTAFNVYRGADATTVSVIEGRVNVSAEPGRTGGGETQILGNEATKAKEDAPIAALSAGEQLQIDAHSKTVEKKKEDPARMTAWRQRRLVFEGATLSEVTQEFNRYNRNAIRVEGEAAELQITGVFNADEPQALLAALRDNPALEIRSVEDGFLIRGR